MSKPLFMCLFHDEVFNNLDDAKKHENRNGNCVAIEVKKKEVEDFRSMIYNDGSLRISL